MKKFALLALAALAASNARAADPSPRLGMITLDQATAPTAPGTGGAFYVDSSNVLHYLNSGRDFPLGGAAYNGNYGINWWIGNYGVGEPSASTSDYATFRVQKTVTGSGGSGIQNGLMVADQVSGNGYLVDLLVNAAAGATSIITSDNPGLAVNAPLYSAGLAKGTTVAAIAHNTPSSGEATITLSTPTAAAMYISANEGLTEIGFGSSGATEAETSLTATCTTWQTSPNLNTCVAGFFEAKKYAPGGVAPFGMDIVSTDNTGLGSAHSGSGIDDAELDINASGPDDATYFGAGAAATSAVGTRKAMRVVATSFGPSVDGPGVLSDALMADTAEASQESEPVTLSHVVRALGIIGWGNIANVVSADGSGAGQTVIDATAGYVTFMPYTQAASGSSTITLAGQFPATVGQLVADASGCIPAGASIASVSEGYSVAHTAITLSAALTCNVAVTDGVTLTNSYAALLHSVGSYSDAFADLTNTTGPGTMKLGSALASGKIATLNFQGDNSSSATASYGSLDWNVLVNTAGSERGQAVINLPNGGDLSAGVSNTQTSGNNFALGYFNVQSGNDWSMGGFNHQTGAYGVALGYQANDFGMYGVLCQANGAIATGGDAENCTVNLRASTTTTAATRLTADGAAASGANVLNLPAGSSAALKIVVVATDVTNKGNAGAWDVPIAALSRSGAASTTAYSGAAASFQSVGASAPASGALAFAADTTNGGLSITWTAPNTDTWHVAARVQAELTQ